MTPYAKALLAVSTVVSIAANTTHAVLNSSAHATVAVAVGIVPPLFLALTVEALALSLRSSRRGAAHWVVTGTVVVVAVSAFALSFEAIRGLAVMVGMTPWTAALLPVVIDATLVASLGLIATDRAITLTDRPVIADDHQADQSGGQTDQPPISTDRTVDIPMIVTGQEVITVERRGDHPSDRLITPLIPAASEEPFADTTSPTVATSDDHAVIAGLIAATGRTQQPIDVIARVLEARAAGRGQKAAGLAAGVSQGAVRQIEALQGQVIAA